MKSFGGSSTEYGYDIAEGKQGGYIICGETLTPAFVFSGCENYFTITDVNGVLLNSFSTGGNACDIITCTRALPDSGYIVAGNTDSYGLTEYDIQIIRFDKNNSIVWSKRLGGANYDEAYGIALTNDGGFAVAGIYSVTSSDANNYVAKLDANGNLVWTCVFGTTSFERLNSIERTSDNGFIVAGQSSGYGAGGPDIVITKISSAGSIVWNTIIKGSNTDQANHAIETFDGGFAVTGFTYSYTAGNADIFICKLNAGGGFNWFKSYGNSVYNDGVDLAQTPDSGIVIAGNSHNGFFTNDNVVVMKTDKNGDLIYAREYGNSTRLEDATAMDTISDGGFAITGSMFGCPSTDYEVLLLKTLPDGTCPNCDSNIITFTTTIGTPTVTIGSTSSTTGGTVTAITPMKKNDASNMTDCSLTSAVLPITLISFTGKANGSKNILDWITASEINNNYFSILKSTDGNNFDTIGKVNGAGTSTQTLNYSFTDEHPSDVINYYVLQQTDFDGQNAFSKTIAIDNSSYINPIIISPNPATDFIQLSFVQAENVFEIEIIDILGGTILKTQNQNKLDISQLPKGIYVLKVTAKNYLFFNKFIKK